jgi:hypothetical protein
MFQITTAHPLEVSFGALTKRDESIATLIALEQQV